jgi:hypothetical protein
MRILEPACRTVLAALMLGAIAAPSPAFSGGAKGEPTAAEAEDDYPYKKILFHDLWENGRPADFYRLTYDGAPEVCGPVIEALHESYRSPQGATHKIARIYLESRLSVEWIDLDYGLGNEVSRVDADIFGDGKVQTMYRYMHAYAKIVHHYLFWSDGIDDSVSEFSYDQLMAVLKARSAYQRGEIPEQELRQFWFDGTSVPHLIHPQEPNFGNWVDVALLNGKHYVLVSNATLRLGVPLSGFVLRLLAGGSTYDLLCAFRTNYILTMPPSKEEETD